MKIKVCDARLVGNSVFVKGIRTRKINNSYVDEAVNIRFNKENWLPPKSVKLPWVVDVKFEKGKGAYTVNA